MTIFYLKTMSEYVIFNNSIALLICMKIL